MPDYENALLRHALNDLTNRAKGGIFIYIVVWLCIGITYQLHDSNPLFFYANVAAFAIIMVFRGAHLLLVKRGTSLSLKLMMNSLVVLIVITAVHWGGLVAWIVYDHQFESIRYIVLVATPGFAIGGAVALSISNAIRIIFPLAMYLPAMIVLFLIGTKEGQVLAFLGTFSITYVYITTTKVRADYWSALEGRVSAEKRADQMEEISTKDPLTGIKNRMYFSKLYEKEWNRSLRHKSYISVLMIDLDYFKQINDTYGHAFGDEYIIEVARVLSTSIQREGECLARYGGEEFVALLGNTDRNGAATVADRLIGEISKIRLNFQGETVSVTCSIGGATMIPSQSIKPDYLLKKADVALYQAKHNGRNQYCEINWASIE